MPEREKLMIIDGNSIINRTFYAIRPLTTKEGIPTNAVYGFLNILYKYLSDYQLEYLCVAFDLPEPTFRHKKYALYKAQRKKMPDELAQQMPILKDVLRAMNICILEKAGYEADDIIGTVSVLCEERDIDCYIVTGDRDDLQLASKLVHICLTTTAKGQTVTTVYDDDAVMQKYGVSPRDLIEVKAIQGDTSDNIPGVAGIGEKGALALVQQYGTLEHIYDDLSGKDFRPAMLKKLTEGKDSAFLSRELGTIDTRVPMEFTIDAAQRQEENTTELLRLYQKLEFRSFAKKLMAEGPSSEGTSSPQVPYQTMSSVKELASILTGITNILYYKLFYDDHRLIAIGLLLGDNLYVMAVAEEEEKAVIAALAPIFQNSTIKKVSHDIKKDDIYLQRHGIKMQMAFFDTMIAAYILEPSLSDYSIAAMAQQFLSQSLESYEDVLSAGKKQLSLLEEVANDALLPYAAQATHTLYELREYETQRMQEQGQYELFSDIEMPLSHVLADMQIAGFLVDTEKLQDFSQMLDGTIAALTQQIFEEAGHEFNINSPKQLGEVLFDELHLPVIKKTKSGYSTNADVLEKLKSIDPIVGAVMEYRQKAKLKSTYCDGLLAVISREDGRIHSTFNQTVTVTGRISSTEPNMQNIPVRTELGREMRKMFVAQEGHVLIDADYSQIELRVLAHIANDETMIDGFQKGVDIHTLTASQVFDTPLDKVTGEMRSAAKAVNFGIVYGIGEYSLSDDIHVSMKEAKRYIDNYLAKYHGVREYMDSIKKTAKEQGYVTTMFGRRRYIPELLSKNHNLRAFGERVALNTPIQGTAADIIKIAMVRVQNRLEKESPAAKLILQVHDELIVEAPKKDAEAVSCILREEMEQAAQLRVKLLVDLKCGHSWYDTK